MRQLPATEHEADLPSRAQTGHLIHELTARDLGQRAPPR